MILFDRFGVFISRNKGISDWCIAIGTVEIWANFYYKFVFDIYSPFKWNFTFKIKNKTSYKHKTGMFSIWKFS